MFFEEDYPLDARTPRRQPDDEQKTNGEIPTSYPFSLSRQTGIVHNAPMVYVPSIYQSRGGQGALMRDDAALAEREAQLASELEDVRQQRRLNGLYMVELGLRPGTPNTIANAAVAVVGVGGTGGNILNTLMASSVPVPITRPPKTWREFIAVALRSANRSLSNKELIEMGAGTEFEDRFKAGPNGFYNTTRMMEISGELVKVGRRLYDPTVYQKIQSGELSDDIPIEDTRASIPSYILKVLRENGSGMTAGGIITAIGRIPETSIIAEKNPALVRTHLTKMRAAAKLINDNGTYKLPEWSRDAEVVLPFPGGGRG